MTSAVIRICVSVSVFLFLFGSVLFPSLPLFDLSSNFVNANRGRQLSGDPCLFTSWWRPGVDWVISHRNRQFQFHMVFNSFSNETVQIKSYRQYLTNFPDVKTLQPRQDHIPMVVNTQYGNDCKKQKFYLAWEMTGKAGDSLAAALGAKPPLLFYANYKNDNKDYFYFWSGFWAWGDISVKESPRGATNPQRSNPAIEVVADASLSKDSLIQPEPEKNVQHADHDEI